MGRGSLRVTVVAVNRSDIEGCEPDPLVGVGPWCVASCARAAHWGGGERSRDRRALRALAVQFFVNGAVWATLASRLPAVRDRVDITIAVLGAVLMIGNLSSLVGSLFTARLLARVSRRWVMILGGGFYVATLPIVGMSRSPIVLAVGLVVLMWFDVFIDVVELPSVGGERPP